MTLGFYGYIGQNYIFYIFKLKNIQIIKKKKLEKKYLKNSPIFCGSAVALMGGYFDKFL